MALGSRGRRSAEERPVVAGTSKVVDAVVVSIRSSVIGSSLASTEMAKNKMPAVSVRALFFVGFVHRRFISFAAKGRFDCFHGRTPLLFPRKNNKNQVSLNGFHPFFSHCIGVGGRAGGGRYWVSVTGFLPRDWPTSGAASGKRYANVITALRHLVVVVQVLAFALDHRLEFKGVAEGLLGLIGFCAGK